MAIGIEGQYVYKFDIGNIEDAIQEADLHSFSMVEQAGNVLPTFSLVFQTDNERTFRFLNEGSDIQLSYGKDFNSLTTVALASAAIDSDRNGKSKRLVVTNGLLSRLNYMFDSKTSITTPLSGVEAIRAIAAKHFTPVFNVDKSLDSQRWVQPNWSDKKFVNEIWLHTDLGSSFPAIGISSDNKFIFKDIKRDLLQSKKEDPARPYRWRFTHLKEDNQKDIAYDGNVQMKTRTGFINSFVGYGREKIVYSLEEGTEATELHKVDPVIAMTKQVARSAEVQKKFAASGLVNDNVHANYQKSYQQNFAYLAAFGNVTASVKFTNNFYPVRVLDLVMLMEDSTESTVQSSEFNSGLYYVSKITRTISNRVNTTTVELCRESLNQIG